MLAICRPRLRPLVTRFASFAGQQQRTSATYLQSFILQHTEVVTEHLTPEIKLLLLTPRCRYWHHRAEHWPYGDPYWAIYWPGGQALARCLLSRNVRETPELGRDLQDSRESRHFSCMGAYLSARHLLDNPDVVRHGRILDLGSGCGAAAIAAEMGGASYVLANDIDPGAAFSLNCRLNQVKPLPCHTENIIGRDTGSWSLIVLGDMFYDEQLADLLHRWLRHCIDQHGTTVLIGDPGRAHFLGHPIQKQLRKVAEYSLPESSKQENYGLTTTAVWKYEP